MKCTDKCLIIFSILLFVTFIHVFQSSSSSAYSQSSNDITYLSNDFLIYYSPFTMIKIHYPSFWEASETLDSKIISFISPIETTGVIIYNMPTLGESANEVLMNMLTKIKNNLPNVIITNTNISYTGDGSAIQSLIFTYGNDSNANNYKVFQLLKSYKDETFVFTYYSTESLFDRFFPLASQMYNSYQVPSYNNIFPTDIYSSDLQFTVNTTEQVNNDQDRFLTYSNNTLGLEIQYPIWLNKTENDRGVDFMFPDKRAGAMLTVSNINPISNDDYITSHLLYLNKSLDNLYILNTSRSDIMGYPTAMILFTYDNSTELYKGLQLWNIKDQYMRLFTYFAPSKSVFDELLPTIIRMLETIKVP